MSKKRQSPLKNQTLSTTEDFWGSIVKRKSKLELEKEKAAQDLKNQENNSAVAPILGRRKRIDDTVDYWKQFESGQEYNNG